MPKYEVTSPDGKVFTIDAPEDATKEEIIEKAKELYKSEDSDGSLDVGRPSNNAIQYVDASTEKKAFDWVIPPEQVDLIAKSCVAVFLIWWIYRLVKRGFFQRTSQWFKDNGDRLKNAIGGVIVLGIIAYFVTSTPSCSLVDEWRGFVYPDSDNLSNDIRIGTFKSLEECRDEATDLISRRGYSDADYECGLNCKYEDDGDYFICAKTER